MNLRTIQPIDLGDSKMKGPSGCEYIKTYMDVVAKEIDGVTRWTSPYRTMFRCSPPKMCYYSLKPGVNVELDTTDVDYVAYIPTGPDEGMIKITAKYPSGFLSRIPYVDNSSRMNSAEAYVPVTSVVVTGQQFTWDTVVSKIIILPAWPKCSLSLVEADTMYINFCKEK